MNSHLPTKRISEPILGLKRETKKREMEAPPPPPVYRKKESKLRFKGKQVEGAINPESLKMGSSDMSKTITYITTKEGKVMKEMRDENGKISQQTQKIKDLDWLTTAWEKK